MRIKRIGREAETIERDGRAMRIVPGGEVELTDDHAERLIDADPGGWAKVGPGAALAQEITGPSVESADASLAASAADDAGQSSRSEQPPAPLPALSEPDEGTSTGRSSGPGTPAPGGREKQGRRRKP